MIENNSAKPEELIIFSNNGAETLYLTENDKPFPPDYYKRRNLHCDSSGDENISVDNDNTALEDDNNFTQESKYEYKNDLRFWYPPKNRYYPFRLFIKDIEIENGKITFFFEDDEPPLIIESSFLIGTFRTGSEVSSPDKYESFWGKKSILQHHFKHVYPDDTSCYWKNETASYYTNIISESLHDGVTSFTITDNDEFEEEWEYLTLPDGVYNRDGVKLAEDDFDFERRYTNQRKQE